MGVSGNLVVGERDVEPDTPSHVAGVHEGNWPGRWYRRRRQRRIDPSSAGGPRRSTGILASAHGPIDPRMPRLTPP